LNGTANTIATLDASGAEGVFALTDATALTQTGTLGGTGVTLSADGLDLDGVVTASNQLDLASTAALTQAGTLGGGTVNLSGTGLALDGVVDAAWLSLDAGSGALTQGASGAINASTLTANGGEVTLNGTANTIATLGDLDASQDLLISNRGTMTLDGAVSAGTSLALITDGLVEGHGSLTADTIALAPYSGGVIDLGGSSVTGLQLSQALLNALDSTATVILGTAANVSAHSILSEGNVSFANQLTYLYSTGGITQNGTLTGTILNIEGRSIALDGQLSANTLHLNASGTITQANTGIMDVSTLTGSGDSILLTGNTNSIATLDGLTANGAIDVQDGTALRVAGTISAASSLDLTAPSLTLASTLTSPLMDLTADSIVDAGGAIDAGTGTVRIAPRTATLTVDLGGNATGLDLSGTLLKTITAGTLDVSTAGSIIADGSASVSAQLLSLAGAGITFAGTLAAPDTLALTSSKGVTSTSAAHLSAGLLRAGGAISGDVNLSQGQNNIATLGSFALETGNFSLVDAEALTLTGPVSTGDADGRQSVDISGTSLTLAGTITTGTLALTASQGVNETGELNADVLTGSVADNAILDGADNQIGTLSNFTAGYMLRLTDMSYLTQAGSLSATNATLNTNGLAFTGNVTIPGTLALASTRNVTQNGGSVSAGMLTSTGTVQGDLLMTQAGNLLSSVHDLSATGEIALTSGAMLEQTGTLSANMATLTAPSLALDGTLTTTDMLQLDGGNIREGGNAAIDTSLLTTGTGSLSGNAVLNNGANRIDNLGSFTAGGGLTLADGEALSINGPVSLGGTLALWDAGGIDQTGGRINAAALTSDGGTISGNVSLGQTGNNIPVLGAFAATGDVLLRTGGGLSLNGDLFSGSTLSLYSGGTIAQNSNGLVTAQRFNASANAIDLTSTEIGLLGDVTTSGDVNIANAGGLAGTLAARDATLGANGDFTSSGTARLSDGLTLTSGGPMTQTGGRISAATATITAPSITLSGATDISGVLALRASGNITHESGNLSAGTLTGTAGQLADFTGTSDIATLGSFLMQDSSFLLNDGEALTLIGPLVANVVSITATGALYLDGNTNGGLFLSGDTVSSTATKPRAGVDSILEVTGDNPSIVQTGTFNIDSGPQLASYLGTASPLATLFLSLANSGTIDLATAPGILEAPSTDLVLASGTAGKITGNVNVLHLEVLNAYSVNMTGSIANTTGPTAAGNGSAFPFPQPDYRFNTCPIGSVNCIILPIANLPQGSPLESFDLSPSKRKKLNKNVIQPGVAARDF
ncbi:beta strand repeat-containing protein, partial [Acidocella sp.]|uniref:beta strand repeat-containing protein n=1 Tax=Acidocella sp. TaxID=50710 RepID=UPI003CFF21AB